MVARTVAAVISEFEYLVNQQNEVKFASFTDRLLLPWFERLGLNEQANDSNDIVRLRGSSFNLLAQHSNNTEVREAAKAQSRQYLAKPLSVPRAIASGALAGVAKNEPAGWLSKFKQAYANTNDSNVQRVLRSAMRFGNDNEVKTTLDFALSDAVDPADTVFVLVTAMASQKKHDLLYQWLNKNVEKTIAKMPEVHVSYMPLIISSSCSQHNIDLAKEFYNTLIKSHPVMQRSFDIAISNSEQCLALKDKHQKDFDRYLADY